MLPTSRGQASISTQWQFLLCDCLPLNTGSPPPVLFLSPYSHQRVGGWIIGRGKEVLVTLKLLVCLVALRGSLWIPKEERHSLCPVPVPGPEPSDCKTLATDPSQYLHPIGCHTLYLSSVSVETLSGALAVQKAISVTLERDVLPTPTVVHFKVTEQGITLTDVQRK